MANKLDIEKIKKERHEILERISEDLKEALVASVIRVPEEIENAPEILTVHFDEIGVSHDDVFGEFFFHNISSDENVTGIFNGLITLDDGLQKEQLPKLYEALTVLNYYMRNGAFGISADGRQLAYRVCLPYPLSMEKEALFDLVNTAIGNAYVNLDEWVDIVLRISEGECDIESITSALGL